MNNPVGYIVINGAAQGKKVLALSRGNKNRRRHWIEHNETIECYVHSIRALRRAIRKKRQWTLEASFVPVATYNQNSTYAELDATPAIPLSAFQVMLFGEAAAV